MSLLYSYRCIKCFNPRSHEGNDWRFQQEIFSCTTVSIHVPTRGTTYVYKQYDVTGAVSIHVPTRGTTALDESE